MSPFLIDCVGYLGLLINLYSMSVKGEYRLRLFSFVANIIYILYGFLIGANPIIIGCFIAVALHGYHIKRLHKKTGKKMIDFKPATINDAKILSLLGRITYAESHGHFIEHKSDLLTYCDKAFSVAKIAQDLQDKNNLFYLVSVDNLPVGYVKIVMNNPFEDKTESTSCRLERIYVLNHFLSMKIGQPLLDFVTQKVKEKKLTTMWLSVYFKKRKSY